MSCKEPIDLPTPKGYKVISPFSKQASPKHSDIVKGQSAAARFSGSLAYKMPMAYLRSAVVYPNGAGYGSVARNGGNCVNLGRRNAVTTNGGMSFITVCPGAAGHHKRLTFLHKEALWKPCNLFWIL